MSTRPTDGYRALTEKEKQTLRLIVRGHDAKSIARSLGLSVHTINERLRDARRKMAVSSSREAARLLLDVEGGTPQSVGDMQIGEATAPRPGEQEAAPTGGAWWASRPARTTTGVLLMTVLLGILALTALPQSTATAPPNTPTAGPTDAAVVDAARHFLELGDQSRWDDGYRATGRAFRTLNTSTVWATASERVRTPLGAMIARVLISQDDVPAPPNGFQVVKFRTQFANKADAVETVSLDREDGGWRVVGVTVG